MADYQLPVDYAEINSSYQDNTTNSITARHGRQLVANAAPFFCSIRGIFNNFALPPGNLKVITKQVMDDFGDNNGYMINGFLVKQSESTYLIENVSGANLTCHASLRAWMGPFTNPDHNFYFAAQQQPPGEPLAGFVGQSITESYFNGSGYYFTISDSLVRRFKKDGKLKVTIDHRAGTGNENFDLVFRLVFQGQGGFRGYASRYDEPSNNEDRGHDIGGVKYE